MAAALPSPKGKIHPYFKDRAHAASEQQPLVWWAMIAGGGLQKAARP